MGWGVPPPDCWQALGGRAACSWCWSCLRHQHCHTPVVAAHISLWELGWALFVWSSFIPVGSAVISSGTLLAVLRHRPKQSCWGGQGMVEPSSCSAAAVGSLCALHWLSRAGWMVHAHCRAIHQSSKPPQTHALLEVNPLFCHHIHIAPRVRTVSISAGEWSLVMKTLISLHLLLIMNEFSCKTFLGETRSRWFTKAFCCWPFELLDCSNWKMLHNIIWSYFHWYSLLLWGFCCRCEGNVLEAAHSLICSEVAILIV